MKKEIFEELTQSLREATEIKHGRTQPSRTFDFDPQKDIVKIRERLGLSQSKFATALDISLDTLQNWEQGRRQPRGPAKALLHLLSNPQTRPDLERIETPSPMSRQQLEVHELLLGYATEQIKFHEFYRGALDALNSTRPDKMAQAAHSMREICDKLPDRIAQIPKFKSPVSPVKALQQDFMTIKQRVYADGWNNKMIDRQLAKLLERLENIFRLFKEPPRTARLKLALMSTDPQAELMSKIYREARDEAFERIGLFFQDVAHHKRAVTGSEFHKELELFESLLLNYLTPRTAAQQNELISLISRPPTAETLARVVELISHKGANFVFLFEKLDNPTWLEALDQRGFFTDLPDTEKMPDGRIKYGFHVALIALIKLAPTAPQEVTKILSKLKLPENPRVADQVIQCMGKIHNRDCIIQLAPLLQQLNENVGVIDWLWIRELLESWKTLDVLPQTLAILRAYLNSVVSASSNEFGNDSNVWLLAEVDKNCLQELTIKNPFEMANIIFRALCKWMERESRRYSDSELSEAGPFSYWLADFKSTPPEYRGVEARLAKSLFAAAENIYLKGDIVEVEKLDRLLRSNSWQLFQRLRWQLYADFPAVTLEYARTEVLKRIPFLMEIDYERGGHDYEFAQLLLAHAKKHGSAFLSAEDVKRFIEAVLQGPVNSDGTPVEGDKERFSRHQLWPILSLLQGEQLITYRTLVSDDSKMTAESYKPYEPGKVLGGEVVSVAPPEADNFSTMTQEQLWTYLNTWEPTTAYPMSERWEQENIFALASKFAQFVNQTPERFRCESKWWKSITRHEVLEKLLDSAGIRVETKQNTGGNVATTPSENDWANWLGIAKWVMGNPWARDSVARFLRKVMQSDYLIPATYFEKFPELLRQLIEEDDSRLAGNKKSFHDWLTTAINSTRGDAFETLLNLALRQKNAGKQPDSWIFESIRSRLDLSGESPAIFALLGSKLRLVTHLFGEKFKQQPNLVFPTNRPEHCSAAIIAHFTYDQPWVLLIETFPELVNIGLDTFEAMLAEAVEDEAKQHRDFGGRLGTHIACYCWTGSFVNETAADRALDRFFSIAPKSTRASVISQIASIWEKQSGDAQDKIIVNRVMRIWERRYAQIKKNVKADDGMASEFDNELAESLDWLSCECLPFEWRFTYAKSSIETMKTAPQAFRLLEAISEFANVPERLEPMLKLLRALLIKPSDQFRWSIQFKNLAPMISLGLSSDSSTTKKIAEECKEALLRLGFSDFLTLG